MFKTADKEELCQISLTGMRALILCGLLMKSPLSLEEIRARLLEYNLIEPEHSDDILRIDLNTLRSMGCEISRSCKSTNYKYVLQNHPFSLQVTEEEVNLLKRAYNKIKQQVDLATLLEYDSIFKKISEHVTDKKIKENILGISILKTADTEKIKELLNDCKYNRTLIILYKAPTHKNPVEKEISLQNIVIKNDKIYIYGFDSIIKEAVTLNLSRIVKILGKKDGDNWHKIEPITIKFILNKFGTAGLNKSEKIIEKTEHGYIIEGEYYNEFLATQRILSFGSTCTVIEPLYFKNKIIDLLIKIRKIYNG